jgi:Icc-related predicted phosphoesterase
MNRMEKIKVVMLSDTYGLHEQIEIPDGDILIHAGNFSPYGEHLGEKAYKSFTEWFCAQPHNYKIFAPGKNDSTSFSLREIYKMLNENTHFLHNNEFLANTTYIYATYEEKYYSCQIHVPVNWAEILEEQKRMIEAMKNSWDKELTHAHILITNHAPWGILDDNKGCQVLAEKVKQSQPNFHVFSGTYNEYGIAKIGLTTYVNASICSFREHKQVFNEMVITNKPIVIELESY